MKESVQIYQIAVWNSLTRCLQEKLELLLPVIDSHVEGLVLVACI